MNAELNNDTNNKDTVEQAQNLNGAGQLATPDVAPASGALDVAQAAQPAAPPTDDRLPNQSCAATQPIRQPVGKSAAAEIHESSNPTDHGQLATDQPATDHPTSARASQEHQLRLPSSAPLPGQRNRVGKVAQLPPDIRDWVNVQLLDEVPYAAILDELDDRGHGHITQQNLTNWKTCGGYNQWLSAHMARQERRSELETICSLISQTRGRLDEAALLVVSSQLLTLVGDYDPGFFKKHLEKDPQAYLRLIQALTRLNKVRQGSKKITQTSLVNKASANGDQLNILPDAERGLTEETLKKITDAIRLF